MAAPPLAASPVLVPVLVLVLVLHMEVGGEGYACGPSGSLAPRKFDWCGPLEVNASLVEW